MDELSAIALGVVQGVTEFLPISSDGHLALGAMVLGIEDAPLAMVVLLHAGTLLATLIVLREDVRTLTIEATRGLAAPRDFFEAEPRRLVMGIVLASAPTAVIGLVLEKHVEGWSRVPWFVGLCLLATAATLALTRRARESRTSLTFPQYVVLGIVQGIAVLPGVSRSALTLATGMAFGLSGPEAFRLSFLLSIPAVAGAVVLELGHLDRLRELGLAGAVGAMTALVVGLAALVLLRGIMHRGRLWMFALYLVPVGLGVIVWDVLR